MSFVNMNRTALASNEYLLISKHGLTAKDWTALIWLKFFLEEVKSGNDLFLVGKIALKTRG